MRLHSVPARVTRLLKRRLQLAHKSEVSQAGRVAARHIRPRAQRALKAGKGRRQLRLPGRCVLDVATLC